MIFLLAAINAKYIHSNPAVYSLAAYASKQDASLAKQIEIAEYTINHQISDILADLYHKKPDAIGISCYIWNITYVKQLISELPKLLPNTKIWLGGPEVTFDAKKMLTDYPQLAGIMIGEGEQTFYELLLAYTKEEEQNLKADIEMIPGLVVRNKEQIIATKQRELTDLSTIPFLYYDLTQFENKIIYYESSRGCPFRCSYCLSSIDKKVRLRDLEVVKKELQFFLDSKVSQVKFVDRTFNCNKKHALEIFRYLLANDNGITNFHFEIAADILDEEEISLLNQFRKGAVQLEIGVQSTNETTIAEIDRKMDVSILRSVVAKIHQGRNIHIHLDLIAGLPYEDYASFGKSFDDVYAMEPEQLQLGFLKVLKGSKMQEKSQEYGISYLNQPPYEVLFTNWLSYEDVCRLKQIEEMVELFYNSNQFRTTLHLLVPYFSSPFAFFEALAAYYVEMGYFIQSPARSYRYHVLLDFIEKKVLLGKLQTQEEKEEKKALFSQSLTMDLYLRENMKTRPDFAVDLASHKETMRAFIQKEAKEHCYLKRQEYLEVDARTLAKMTHMEPISFHLETGKPLREESYLLFDYLSRDPLTYDASFYVLSKKDC